MAAETPTYIYGNNLNVDSNGNRLGEYKQAVITLDNTADATDTHAVDLSLYGISTFVGVLGVKETTDGSVIVAEQPTTAVSGTTLTLTIPAGTDNDPRTYIIYGV